MSTIFTGVVVSSLTVKEPPDYVTRVQIRNNYQELRKRTINLTVVPGQTKSSAILQAITQAGGIIAPGQRAAIQALLPPSAIFEEVEIISESLDNFLSRFKKTFPKRINFNWDSAGVAFYPLGKIDPSIPPKLVNVLTGLIGSPQATSVGVNFKVRLDANLRVNQSVSLQSDATTRLSLASASPSAIERVTLLVVFKVIHQGDNRDGEFSSLVETQFLDNVIQVTG